MSHSAQVLFSVKNTVTADFLAATGMGAYSNLSALHKFGFNAAVGSSFETIWEEGGVYVFPASASIMKISSSDIDDTSAGAGANTVVIEGLDSDCFEISETVSLNGQTAVNTVNSYLRINRMYVVTAGSTGWNEGIVYAGTGVVTSGKPAVVYGLIGATNNQTLMSLYTVPARKTAYLFNHWMYSSIAKDIDVRLLIREEGSVFRVKDYLAFIDGQLDHQFNSPLELPAKTDIQVQAMATGGGGSLAADLLMVLLDDQ